jgi:hypothetical protein
MDKVQKTKNTEIHIESVKDFGTLKIHQLDRSQFWYCRFRYEKKIVRKSLKTSDKKEAIKLAKVLYANVMSGVDTTTVISKTDFEKISRQHLKVVKNRCERGELSEKKYKQDLTFFEKYLLPNFKNVNFKDITYQMLTDLANKLSTENKWSSNTLKIHFSFIRVLMTHAVKTGVIQTIPPIPKFTTIDNVRSWFSTTEYKKLHTFVRNNIGKEYIIYQGQKQTPRKLLITEEIYDLILFSMNTFIRPTDAKILKHNHISIQTNNNVYLRLTPPSTKRHTSPYVSMIRAVDVYLNIIDRQKKQDSYKSDGYVFGSQYDTVSGRQYWLNIVELTFRKILEDIDLYVTSQGETRSLYSLRHSSISLRILESENLDTLTLARNSRTSSEMLERFYTKHLQPEMMVEKIQSHTNIKLQEADDELQNNIRKRLGLIEQNG